MILNNSKYLKIISLVVLISYLALFTLNILHHHPIKVNNESALKVSNGYQLNNHYSIYSELNCPVHNYFTSVHNLNFESNNIFDIYIPEFPLKKLVNDFSLINQSNHLVQFRGPPTIVIS
jgi:hypothetical protein